MYLPIKAIETYEMLIIVLQYTIENLWKNYLKILKRPSLRNTTFVSLPKLLTKTAQQKCGHPKAKYAFCYFLFHEF